MNQNSMRVPTTEKANLHLVVITLGIYIVISIMIWSKTSNTKRYKAFHTLVTSVPTNFLTIVINSLATQDATFLRARLGRGRREGLGKVFTWSIAWVTAQGQGRAPR